MQALSCPVQFIGYKHSEETKAFNVVQFFTPFRNRNFYTTDGMQLLLLALEARNLEMA